MLRNAFRLKLLSVLVLTLTSHHTKAGVLLELYQQAITNNPTILSKQFIIDQTKAREDLAFSKLLPQITANGSYSKNQYNSISTGVQNYPGLRGVVQARQALFDLATFLRYRSAEDSTRQATAEQDAYRLELSGELLDRYLLTLEAVDKISYLQEEKNAVDMQVKRLTEMQKRQMVKITDLYEVQAYHEQLATQIIEAENEKAISLEQLREISGILPTNLDLLSVQLFPKAPNNVEQWISDAINSNPGLYALHAALDSAEHNMAASRADHLPVLSLQAIETYSDQSFDNRQISPTGNGYQVSSVNLLVNVPIYEGGRVEAGYHEASAKRQIVLQEFEKLKREIERQTRSAFLNASSGESKIDSTLRHLEAIKKTHAAKQQGYELGVNTIVDVLESQRDVYKAHIEYQKSCYDYARSLIMLRVWSGGLSVENIEEIDKWFSGH
ncbi:TolC family protein [Methylomonas sp. AM2-LC]|uniref:TolC family protein n=1 Tax=Methylomonas sp. AM2-LC TaxID=3153301 RepID=UPI0032647D63